MPSPDAVPIKPGVAPTVVPAPAAASASDIRLRAEVEVTGLLATGHLIRAVRSFRAWRKNRT